MSYLPVVILPFFPRESGAGGRLSVPRDFLPSLRWGSYSGLKKDGNPPPDPTVDQSARTTVILCQNDGNTPKSDVNTPG